MIRVDRRALCPRSDATLDIARGQTTLRGGIVASAIRERGLARRLQALAAVLQDATLEMRACVEKTGRAERCGGSSMRGLGKMRVLTVGAAAALLASLLAPTPADARPNRGSRDRPESADTKPSRMPDGP